MVRLSRMVLAALVLAGCRPTTEPAQPRDDDTAAVEPTLDEPLPDDPLAVTVHRLDNGMTVFVSPMPSASEVSARIVVRAGAADDPDTATGLAHYLEHLMFKGTREIGTVDFEAEKPHLDAIAAGYRQLRDAPDEAAQARIWAEIDAETLAAAKFQVLGEFEGLYSRLGISDLNARTRYDMTEYTATVPRARLQTWAMVEAERFSDPVFRLFFPELEVVYDEKNGELDDPRRRMSRARTEAVFRGHPYARSVLGTREHLRRPDYDAMVAFFERHYVPGNMAVVLAGDVDAAEVLPLLQRSLGSISATAVGQDESRRPERPRGRQFVEVPVEGLRGLELGFATVDASDADASALAVLAEVLGHPRAGLLPEALLRGGLASSVEVAHEGYHQSGRFKIEVESIADDPPLEVLETEVLGVVQRVQAAEVEPGRIGAIASALERAELRRFETADGRAEAIAEAYGARQSWASFVAARAARREVDADDLARVATKYLGDDYVAVHTVDGPSARASLPFPENSPLQHTAAPPSDYARAVLESAPPLPAPRFATPGRDYSVAGGGATVHVPNRLSDLGQVEYRFGVGLRSQPHVCTVVEFVTGTGPLQAQLFGLGVELQVECGRDRVLVRLAGLDENLPAAVQLVRERIAMPHDDLETEAESWKEFASMVAHRHAAMQEDSDLLVEALTQYAAYGPDSEFRLVGSDRQLSSRIGVQEAAEISRAVLRSPHRVAYFGPREPDVLPDSMKGADGENTPAPAVPMRFVRPPRPTIFLVDTSRSEADVRVLLPGRPWADQEHVLASLVQVILGTDGLSRVSMELRERRGLAYEADGGIRQPATAGDDVAVRGSTVVRADQVAMVLPILIDTLRQGPRTQTFPVAVEVLRQRLQLGGVSPRNLGSAVAAWRDLGVEADPGRSVWAALPEVEFAQLEEFWGSFRDSPPIVAIGADLERVDRRALSKLGKVVEVKPPDLFGWNDS